MAVLSVQAGISSVVQPDAVKARGTCDVKCCSTVTVSKGASINTVSVSHTLYAKAIAQWHDVEGFKAIGAVMNRGLSTRITANAISPAIFSQRPVTSDVPVDGSAVVAGGEAEIGRAAVTVLTVEALACSKDDDVMVISIVPVEKEYRRTVVGARNVDSIGACELETLAVGSRLQLEELLSR